MWPPARLATEVSWKHSKSYLSDFQLALTNLRALVSPDKEETLSTWGPLCLNSHLRGAEVSLAYFLLLETELTSMWDSFILPLVRVPLCLSSLLVLQTVKALLCSFVPTILSSLLISGLIFVPSLLRSLSIKFENPRHPGATLLNPRSAKRVLSLSCCCFLLLFWSSNTEDKGVISSRRAQRTFLP